MANIIGILLGKPDCIIGCNFYTHNTEESMRRRNLLKFLGVWIEDSQVIATHLAEPDTPCMINSCPHQPAVVLWQWLLFQISYRPHPSCYWRLWMRSCRVHNAHS